MKIFAFCVVLVALIFTVSAADVSNHEDIYTADFFYNTQSDSLTVQGFAPDDGGSAKSAIVNFIASDNANSQTSSCIVVAKNGEPEYHLVELNISSNWAEDVYEIEVLFYDTTDCSGTAFDQTGYAGEFDFLAIQDLQNKFENIRNQLNLHLPALYIGLFMLNSKVDNLDVDLQSQIDDLQSELDALNQSMQSQIDDLDVQVYNLSINLTSLNQEVDSLNQSMQSQIDDLQSQIDILEDALNAGTINLRYKASLKELDVWGKAPQGATGAVLKLKRTNNFNDVVLTMTTTVKDYQGFENSYKFTAWNGNSVDVSNLDNESYDVEVTFTGLAGSFMVTDVFTNLELEGIQDSISILKLEDQDLWIAVDDNTNNISYLWQDSENQWISINQLKKENFAQWQSINDLWRQNMCQWMHIFSLWQDSYSQWRQIKWLWHAVDGLDNRVDNLEYMIEYMNHATINLKYHNKDAQNNPDSLRVWGEAPFGAEEYQVVLKAADATVQYETEKLNVEQLGDNENSFNTYFSLDNIEHKEYNIIVKFYNEQGYWMSGYNVGDTFSELETLGVHLVNIDQKVHLLGKDSTTEYIAYSFKIDESIDDAQIVVKGYRIDEEVSFYQVLRVQDIVGSENYYITSDELNLTEGKYELYIEIEESPMIEHEIEGDVAYVLIPQESSEWRSEDFTVEVVDFPENGALFTSPEENWFVGFANRYYPDMENPFSEYNEIYWHSFAVNKNFDLDLTAYEGTQLDKCEWWYSIDEDVSNKIEFYETSVSEDQTICHSTIANLGLAYDFENEGIYTIHGRADFTGIEEGKTDSMVLGIDNTKPFVEEIIPSKDFYSRDLKIASFVGDDLSGINNVQITMLSTQNSSINQTLKAEFDNENSTYYAVFDTTQLVDGEYEINVVVEDNAGNTESDNAYVFVDNTAPAIEFVETNFDNVSFYEGENIYVKVQIKDKLAGIDKVWLEIDTTNISCELSQISGDAYLGMFETDDTCMAPFYNGMIELNTTLDVIVKASDLAIESNQGGNTTSIWLIDPILNLTDDVENTTCVIATNIESIENNQWITLSNICEVNATASLLVGFEQTQVNVEVGVEALSNRSIFISNGILISAPNAIVTNISYNPILDELEFTANGNGTQEVVIYVGSLDVPEDVYFDGSLISNWTYSNGYVYATVTFGSPHTLLLSWFVEQIETVSKSSSGHSSGGSGFTSFATAVIEDANLTSEVKVEPIVNQAENQTNDESNQTQESKSSQDSENSPTTFTPTAQAPEVGLGGNIAANTPTIVGALLGLLIIGALIFFVMRKKE